MEYTVNKPLSEFNFNYGAAGHAANFTKEQLDKLEYYLIDYYEGRIPTENEINEFFWFESDTLRGWLGINEDEDIEEEDEDIEDEDDEEYL